MLTDILWASLLAFSMSAICCYGLKRVAHRVCLVDMPDERKHHNGAVPLVGGLAMFLAFALTMAIVALHDFLSGRSDLHMLALLPGLLLLLCTGVIDDRHNLPAVPRLIAQYIAAALIIGFAGLASMQLGAVPWLSGGQIMTTGLVLTGSLFLLVATTFIVGMANAVNMSDGVDGLAGTASIASLFWLLLIAHEHATFWLVPQLAFLLAAILGFLVFNLRAPWRRRASLFMGDGGSTLLGAALGGFILVLSERDPALTFPALVLVVIIPVLDTLSLMFRRVLARKSPFAADRNHLHHLLQNCGLSAGQIAMTMAVMNLVTGGLAYLAIQLQLPLWLIAVHIAVIIALHSIFVMRASTIRRPSMPIGTRVFLARNSEASSGKDAEIKLPGVYS